MEYQCLEDRVLIKKIKEQEGKKSEGGIITDTIQRQTLPFIRGPLKRRLLRRVLRLKVKLLFSKGS